MTNIVVPTPDELKEICEWAEANGLDPQQIPTSSVGLRPIDGNGDQWSCTYRLFVVDGDGNRVLADDPMDGFRKTDARQRITTRPPDCLIRMTGGLHV